MKDVDNSSFLSIPTDVETSRGEKVAPWSSAAAGAAAAGAAAAAAHHDFAEDLWKRLVDRIPADPPCSIVDDASASPSPISQDLGDSCGHTMSFFRERDGQPSSKENDIDSQQAVGPVGAAALSTQSAGPPEPPSTRRQLFVEGHLPPDVAGGLASSADLADDLHLEDSMAEEFLQFSRLLRRHGFQPPQPSGGRIALDVKGLWSLCTEVLHAYGERGRRLQQALLGERSEERQKSDGRVQDLLRQNSKLQEELNATRSSRRDLAADRDATASSLMTSPTRTQPARDRVDKGAPDLAFRTQKAEALARQRERELEKLKKRLEQALAVKRKEMESPETRGKKVINKADCAETTSLRKQVSSLTFQLEEAEAKLRQAEAVQSRQRAPLPPLPASPAETLVMEEASSRVEEAKKALQAERELRADLEEQLREVQLRHATEMRSMSGSLQEAQEKADRLQAELRMRHSSETTWQREASKLRDDLVEARKTWKGMDARSLMKRDKELRRLGLDAHALEESIPKADLLDMFLELCRVMKTNDMAGLLGEVKRLETSRQTNVEASQEMMQLAQGSLDALKELHGKALSPAEVLGEVKQMCTRFKSSSSHRNQETQACLEPSDLTQLKQGQKAQADVLQGLATAMGCSADELPARAKALVKKCQDQVAEHRTACKLREDLAEARRAWKSVDTRSLIKRDKELRRLGLDKEALEESIPKADLVDMFLELCRLLKTKDMPGLVSEVKSLSRLQGFQGFQESLEEQEAQGAKVGGGKEGKDDNLIERKREDNEKKVYAAGELAIECQKCRETSEAQAEMLQQLAAVMGCCKDELPNRAHALVQKCHEHLAAQRLACKLRDDLAEARKAWKAQTLDAQGRRRRLELPAEEEPKADLLDMFLELRRVVKTLVAEVEMLGSREAPMMQLAQGSLDALQALHGETLSPEEVLCKVKDMCSRWKEAPESHNGDEVLNQLTTTLGCSNDELPKRAEALLRKCQENVAAQHIVAALQKLLYVESVSEVLPSLKEVLDVAALRQKVLQRASQSSGQGLAAGGA